MITILSQDGNMLIKPRYIDIYDGVFVQAEVRDGERIVIANYDTEKRAREVLREMLGKDYYEMPLN